MSDTPASPWSRHTKDLWFFGALGASTVAVMYLFSTFMYVLLFASVVVVVTWPIFSYMLVKANGRRALAAALTLLVLALVIFGPLGFLIYLFVQQAIAVVQIGIEFVSSGKLAGWIGYVLSLPQSDRLPDWVARFIPEDFDLQREIAKPLQDGALAALNAASGAVPGLLSTTMNASIDLTIFVFAVITLYMEGPRVLRVIKNLSPMEDEYDERLFDVFREFANNLVVGALATAVVQGVVASIGYAIAGVDRLIFFAILTAVFSFVPIVGTMVVWIPLAIATGVEHGLGWGLFLAGWSIVFTSQVDSLVRPMFMRGRTNIHPLLIFLAVFGGMAWMGLPGALVGPVLVAFFLALYTIYVEDYLGVPTAPSPAPPPGAFAKLLARRAEQRVLAVVDDVVPTDDPAPTEPSSTTAVEASTPPAADEPQAPVEGEQAPPDRSEPSS